MNAWMGVATVLGVLAVLIGCIKLLRSFLSPEVSRKAVHVGMGLVCLSFPWLFVEPLPVVVLAILAIAGLTAVRFVPALKRTLGGVLGGVERQSWGEFYFPVAVAAVYWLAQGNVLLYVIPILTLTVADSVGALIGLRYGFARYRTDEGLKSAEGSVAFFTAAFLSCHIPLLLFSDTGRTETLLIGLTAGFVVMLLEAIAWRGQDNLIIPLGMFFLLQTYLPMSVSALLWRLLVILGLVVLVVVWRNRTTLSDSAVLAGALSGYAVWALGGWFWLAPPLLLFLVYVGLPSFPAEIRPQQNLHAVTRVMAGGFFWLALAKTLERPEFLSPYFICMAAHSGNIAAARLRVRNTEWSPLRTIFTAWLIASVAFGVLGVIGEWQGAWPWSAVFLMPLAVGVSVSFFFRHWPLDHLSASRTCIWATETLIAVVVSLFGLIPFFLS